MKIAYLLTLVAVLIARCRAASKCGDLEALFKKQRFLTYDEREEYCHLECEFLRGYKCEDRIVGFNFTAVTERFRNYFRDVKDGTVDLKKKSRFTLRFDRYVVEKSLAFLLPYMSVLIPIGAQTTFQPKTFWAQAVCAIYFVIMFIYYNRDAWILLHALTYAFIGATIPTSTKIYSDLVTSYVMVLIVAAVSVSVEDMWVQFAVGVISTLVVFESIMRAYKGKTESQRILVLVNVLQVGVIGKYMQFLISRLAINSSAVAAVKLYVDATLPFGEHDGLWENAVEDALYLVEHLPEDGDILSFYFALATYISIFLLTRCALGSLVLSTLRFKFAPDALLTGLYSYAIDLWTPWYVVFGVVEQGRGEMKVRKLAYAVAMLVLFCFEFFCARDVILLRLMVWIVDKFVIQSGLDQATKFLQFDFDCSDIAFPKIGSFPFFSLAGLNEVAKHVQRLEVTIKTAEGGIVSKRSGVGLVRKDFRGTRQLVTVRHVVDGAHEVEFLGERVTLHDVSTLGRSTDPVSTVQLTDRGEGCEIAMLSKNEMPAVSFLCMVTPEGPIAMINDFKFVSDGDISVTANLRPGDSGSPIVAVLKNGALRLAGAVSRGSFGQGSGNYVSSCVQMGPGSGSPGFFNAYLDVPGFTSDIGLNIIKRIRELMAENREDLMKNLTKLEDWKQHGEGWERGDDVPEDFKRRASERKKSWRKDAAFKRRQAVFGEVLGLSEMHRHQEIVDKLKDAFDDGVIMDFNQKRSRYALSDAKFIAKAKSGPNWGHPLGAEDFEPTTTTFVPGGTEGG